MRLLCCISRRICKAVGLRIVLLPLAVEAVLLTL